jgi:hypothetical protein
MGSNHTIWDYSTVLDTPQKLNIIELEIPIDIDPTVRAISLVEWPKAAPLPHSSR